jgi:hypothetical protein
MRFTQTRRDPYESWEEQEMDGWIDCDRGSAEDGPMPDMVFVGGYQDQAQYEQAEKRINETPELEQYRDIILYDWPEGEQHWTWIAQAKIQEIVDWCESIRQDEALTTLEESVC